MHPSPPHYNQTKSMSLETELEAIRTGAAIYPLTDRAFLRITGSDATRWLNGMVTNSIQSLQPGEGNYNFLLNAQGRIQGDCTIYREPSEGEATFLLETDKSQIETIQTLLDKFIIMDDVELTRGLQFLGYEASGMAVLGHNAPALIKELFTDKNENDEPTSLPGPQPGRMIYATLKHKEISAFFIQANEGLSIILTPSSSSQPRFDIWFPGEDGLQQARKLMEGAGAIDLSKKAQEAHRILTATPKYGIDIRNTETNKDLPQETAQTHALHFNKGCYLGQEIVERIRSRGQVHRTFTQFTLTGLLPQPPASLESNGKPAGELTSAADIPGRGLIALGYLRREFAAHPLTYPGGTATPKSGSS